jgi:hypothetical protein
LIMATSIHAIRKQSELRGAARGITEIHSVGNQKQSEAIRGNQRQSAARRSNQRQSEAISEAIRGQKKHIEAIILRQSAAISGNQRQTEAIRSNQM